ncbi:MAG: 4Fe-4S binding protein [Deltaproteobacteria bacterium]|nr:4Fe-4S binding protein [Deltaproteobacteria bacterium]
MKIFGPNELSEDVLKKGLCVGCGACVNLCPYYRTHLGKTAMVFPCTLTEGRCFAYCPKVEVDLDELAEGYWGHPYEGKPLGDYQEVIQARAGEKAPAGGFQAGGAVSALAAFALETGLIDGAVLTDRDGLTAVPRLAFNREDVAACASTKFMAAPTLQSGRKGRKRQSGRGGNPMPGYGPGPDAAQSVKLVGFQGSGGTDDRAFLHMGPGYARVASTLERSVGHWKDQENGSATTTCRDPGPGNG